MRRFRKTAVFTLIAAMVLSLAGCGKKQDESNNSATPSDADSQEIVDDYDWVTTEAEAEENPRFNTVEGADVIGVNFDDNTNSGFVSYTNGGSFTMTPQDGKLVLDIASNGIREHACQIYYDGFTMAKGCVYTISFDISSTVDRVVEWRVQINGGDYHAYASEKINLTAQPQTITKEFVMEESSDPAPRFVINMGMFDGVELPAHQITLDNVSLFVTDSSNADKIEGAPVPIQVKVNQIGYAPDDTKTVIATSKEDERFKIVDANTGETVYIGEYDPTRIYDPNVGSSLHKGDFSDFKTPGTYRIISSPSGESYEFSIGENLYDDIYKDVVRMLYNQRCGSDLDEDISGIFAHEACHMSQAVVYGDDSKKTYDVSGGWHDAGDYGRYVVPGAKTVQDLFLAYEDYNQKSDDMGIPESGNGIPDLLDEAKYELDWMLKMQDPETGGVYHKVTALVFPETVLAVDETDQLVLAPISYAATADFAAVMAKASILYTDIDSSYATKCLEVAKKAYAFLEANPDMGGFQNPDEIVTGEYPDSSLDDELLWAATELYIATGDKNYLSTVKNCMENDYRTGFGWASIGTYALYDLAKTTGVDEAVQTMSVEKIIAMADKLLAKCKEDGFFMGLSTYGWGSNKDVADNGMLFLVAYKLKPDEEYLEYAQKHRDYLFGVNGTGYCYITGYGQLSPVSTHHRPSQVLGETMPGMLVGGPNSSLQDPYANAVLYGFAPALCYVDNEQSFSCNEITIYWNSPLIYLMTGLIYQ